MLGVEETEISCPYCGELITVLIDCSIEGQQYIEDCEVCCRPIILGVRIVDDQEIHVTTQREDD